MNANAKSPTTINVTPRRADMSRGPIRKGRVEYVRADLVRAIMPTNWEDEPDTRALARALGLDKS